MCLLLSCMHFSDHHSHALFSYRLPLFSLEYAHEEYVYSDSLRPCNDSSVQSELAALSVEATQAEIAPPAIAAAAAAAAATAPAPVPEPTIELTPHMMTIISLLESENVYVHDLDTLHRVIIDPTFGAIGNATQLLDQDTFDSVFGKLLHISNLNAQMLSDFDSRFSSSTAQDIDPEFGDLLLKYIPFFKMYAEYIHEYNTQGKAKLTKLLSSGKFASYVKRMEQSNQLRMSLLLYMQAPVDRIKQYATLIASMAQTCTPNSTEHQNLQSAQKLFESVINTIKQSIGDRDNQEAILKLESKFRGTPSFASPGRFIIREGELTKKSRSFGGDDKSYVFYLFNDLLAYSTKGWKRKLHGKIHINRSFAVRKLPRYQNEHRILIASADKTFVMYSMDEKTRDAWVTSLESCITKVQESIPATIGENAPPVQPLPAWMSSDSVPDFDGIFKSNTVAANTDSSSPTNIIVVDPASGVAPRNRTRKQVLHQLRGHVQKTVFSRGVRPKQATGGWINQQQQMQAQAQETKTVRRPTMPPVSNTSPHRRRRTPSEFRSVPIAGAPQAVSATVSVTAATHSQPKLVAAAVAAGATSGAKFCGNCGGKRKTPTWKFCDQCGTAF
jgi:RhoGEF domain/PH domain